MKVDQLRLCPCRNVRPDVIVNQNDFAEKQFWSEPYTLLIFHNTTQHFDEPLGRKWIKKCFSTRKVSYIRGFYKIFLCEDECCIFINYQSTREPLGVYEWVDFCVRVILFMSTKSVSNKGLTWRCSPSTKLPCSLLQTVVTVGIAFSFCGKLLHWLEKSVFRLRVN